MHYSKINDKDYLQLEFNKEKLLNLEFPSTTKKIIAVNAKFM
jgi:hypothetical protein